MLCVLDYITSERKYSLLFCAKAISDPDFFELVEEEAVNFLMEHIMTTPQSLLLLLLCNESLCSIAIPRLAENTRSLFSPAMANSAADGTLLGALVVTGQASVHCSEVPSVPKDLQSEQNFRRKTTPTEAPCCSNLSAQDLSKLLTEWIVLEKWFANTFHYHSEKLLSQTPLLSFTIIHKTAIHFQFTAAVSQISVDWKTLMWVLML